MQDSTERFWSKVDVSAGCWIWTGARQPRGYGVFRYRSRNVYAHRAAWQLAFGPIPDGLLVCHRCDNPSCCNPAHLFLGTHADNHADRNRKGRQAQSERHGRAKLTTAQVDDIRRSTESARSVARRLGMAKSTIDRIRDGSGWK